MKNNQKEESQKAYAINFREGYYKILQNIIYEIMKAPILKLHNLPKNDTLDFQKKIADDFAEETKIVYALTTALRYQGKPKSLIFITESGKAIDLLEVKKLKEEQAWNQIFDNLSGD